MHAGMTLVEVAVALVVAGLGVTAIVNGYMFCVNSAEKSALSLAANARANARLEEIRSARWDTASIPAVDQVVTTNFPDQVVILDFSGSGTNVTYATNFTQISQIAVVSPLKRIHIDCVWSFKNSRLMTNTIETCRAPDQ